MTLPEEITDKRLPAFTEAVRNGRVSLFGALYLLVGDRLVRKDVAEQRKREARKGQGSLF